MNNHEGKVALVTGGAQGIGASIVEKLYEQGAHVIIVDLQREKAETLISNLKNDRQKLLLITSDISTQEGCKNVVDKVVDNFSYVDILINNAAPSRNKKFIGCLSQSNWDDHSNLVVQSVVWLTEYLEPYLKKSISPSIINISSVTANKIGLEQCGWPYHVSKSGLEQLTRYLACRMGSYNIRVNAIAPGLVDRDEGMKISEIPGNSKIIKNIVPLKRSAHSKEIANVASFLGSSDASYITGQIITVDGGLGLLEGFSAALKLSDQ